ncbi:MAG: hypothetical protein ABFD89_25265 [Bryobacteraceae bacterium]
MSFIARDVVFLLILRFSFVWYSYYLHAERIIPCYCRSNAIWPNSQALWKVTPIPMDIKTTRRGFVVATASLISPGVITSAAGNQPAVGMRRGAGR